MYQLLDRTDGEYPAQSWIASPSGVYSDAELERALADFLRLKALGLRVLLLWVPDYDQGRGHQGMDHLSPARCPDEYRAAATGLFATNL